MTEYSDGSLFLKAEEQASRISAELERLAATLHNYQAVAGRLDESARGLGALAAEQKAAATQLEQLTSELRRLSVEETQRRLDKMTAELSGISTSVGEIAGVVRKSADAGDQLRLRLDARLGAIEQAQFAITAESKQLEARLRKDIGRSQGLLIGVLVLAVLTTLMLANMFFVQAA